MVHRGAQAIGRVARRRGRACLRRGLPVLVITITVLYHYYYYYCSDSNLFLSLSSIIFIAILFITIAITIILLLYYSYSYFYYFYHCTGASLVRNHALSGSYSRTMHRALWWSQGVGVLL